MKTDVEVAVAHMTDERREEARGGQIGLGLTMQSARREIGTQASVVEAARPGRERDRRVKRVVPRLPQPRAVLGRALQAKPRAARLGGDGRDMLGLLLDARASEPWNSKNSVGASGNSVFE